MRGRAIYLITLLICSLSFARLAAAQTSPATSITPADPLHRTQSAETCSNDASSSCAAAAAKILPLVMGPSPMEENLRRLTDEIGGRVSGTPQMAHAIQWGVAAFRAAGVEVHTEKYQLPLSWSEGDTRLELLGDIKFPLRTVSLGWSPATPPGGIEANVVDVGYGTPEDFDSAGARIKGALLLVHTNLGSTWADLDAEYSRPPDIIERALSGGAAAILWESARERLLLYRHTNTGDGQLELMPQAIVAREDALRLSRTVLAYPGKIRARFSMPNKIGPPVEQENVVAEIRGYEKPDEAVILGAHLDSWDLGTGATDNGTGSMAVLAAARALQKSGLKPKRTIRFVLFTGEEQGLNGSRAYVKQHKDELAKISGMLVHDTGTGKVLTIGLMGNYGARETVDRVVYPLAELAGIMEPSMRSEGGSDHVPFDEAGVPGFWCVQDEADYDKTHHSQADTLDRVRWDDLTQGAEVLAVFGYNTAQLGELLPRKAVGKK